MKRMPGLVVVHSKEIFKKVSVKRGEQIFQCIAFISIFFVYNARFHHHCLLRNSGEDDKLFFSELLLCCLNFHKSQRLFILKIGHCR